MTKYGAKKVIEDDIRFDSKMERDYYLYLKQQRSLGKIKGFELQPSFELQSKFEKEGKKYRAITYKADFKVIHNDDSVEIIDVKGFETALGTLKLKMFHYNYPYNLKLITYSKIDNGWIELEDLKKARKVRKEVRLNKKKGDA